MKFKRIYRFVTIFFLLSGFAITGSTLTNQLTAAAPSQSIWKKFSSLEGGFSILMPGTPQEDKQTVNAEMGNIQKHTFKVVRQQEEVKYIVSYTEYPEQYIQLLQRNKLVEKALENGKNLALKQEKGLLVSDTKININNYLGKEIIYTKQSNKIVLHRIYLINNRLYQIVVETTHKRKKYLHQSITGFFNSFNLLNN